MNKGKRILVVLLSCVLLAGCAGKVNETGGINENSSSEEKIQKEEQQEFLNLLDRITPEQREALKKVLKSFI